MNNALQKLQRLTTKYILADPKQIVEDFWPYTKRSLVLSRNC